MNDFDGSIDRLIESKLDTLTKGEKKVASYIQNNPLSAALLSSTDLANSCGVSDTTVIRFAQDLGFKGYADFKKNMVNVARSPYHFLRKMEQEHKQHSLEKEYLQNAINGVQDFTMSFDFAKLDKAVDIILGANEVFCIGMGTDSIMSKFLSIYLQKIGLKVTYLSEGGIGLWDNLLSATPNDAIILFSFPRYLKDEKRIGEIANRDHIPLITITKSDAVDVLWNSNVNFPVTEEQQTFFNSMLIPSLICNLILLKIYTKRPEMVSANLQRYLDFSIPDWV